MTTEDDRTRLATRAGQEARIRQATLEHTLGSILRDWPDLENFHVSSGVVTGGGNESQLPGGTLRMSLITEAATLAMSWTLMRLDEWDREGNLRAEDSTPGRLRFLLTHVEWMSEHPIVDEALEVLPRLAGDIRSLVAPSGVRRIPIGACPADDCGGAVFAFKRDGDPTMPDLTCDLDREHTWPETHYHHLARMLGTDGPERMTVAEFIAYIDGRFKRQVPEQTVRSWVRRYPVTIGWNGETLERVAATAHYLDRRAKAA